MFGGISFPSVRVTLSSSLERLHAIGQRVTGRPLIAGNQLQMLENGDAAYPRMLDAIRAAQSSVYCSTYIFDRDRIGNAFAEALRDAARRGVDVRVLVDGIGEWYSPRRISTLLARAGCRVARFLPPSIFPPSIHINLRYHRKLLPVSLTPNPLPRMPRNPGGGCPRHGVFGLSSPQFLNDALAMRHNQVDRVRYNCADP